MIRYKRIFNKMPKECTSVHFKGVSNYFWFKLFMSFHRFFKLSVLDVELEYSDGFYLPLNKNIDVPESKNLEKYGYKYFCSVVEKGYELTTSYNYFQKENKIFYFLDHGLEEIPKSYFGVIKESEDSYQVITNWHSMYMYSDQVNLNYDNRYSLEAILRKMESVKNFDKKVFGNNEEIKQEILILNRLQFQSGVKAGIYEIMGEYEIDCKN